VGNLPFFSRENKRIKPSKFSKTNIVNSKIFPWWYSGPSLKGGGTEVGGWGKGEGEVMSWLSGGWTPDSNRCGQVLTWPHTSDYCFFLSCTVQMWHVSNTSKWTTHYGDCVCGWHCTLILINTPQNQQLSWDGGDWKCNTDNSCPFGSLSADWTGCCCCTVNKRLQLLHESG